MVNKQATNSAELDAKLSGEPQIPEDLVEARQDSLRIITDYQDRRVRWYDDIKLVDVLRKDIAMFAARGVSTVDQLLDEAFRAVESSSEETMMGTHWQRILATISRDTFDTGDLTTERDGAIWVCEVKSQRNTTNSSSFPQELRSLRTRQEEIKRRRRASNQPVKAAYCVLRDDRKRGKGVDEERVFPRTDVLKENEDLAGFEYRYISGKQFWGWLTGFESEVALLMPLDDIAKNGYRVAVARERSKDRLRKELHLKLTEFGLADSIDDVVKLRDVYL